MVDKVTDPLKRATDAVLLKVLAEQGMDSDYVEFSRDYTSGHPGAKFYRDLRSKRRFMVVSGLPKVDDAGTKIDAGWVPSGAEYRSKANLFSAAVAGGRVSVSCRGRRTTWDPQLFLDDAEVPPLSKQAVVLAADPDNENYSHNILEWDYGICKRRLRLIHGGIFERWVVPGSPHGELRVRHNFSRNDLGVGLSGAVDASGDRLGKVEGDCEMVSAAGFDGAVYPVVIGASLTVYSTSSDSDIYTSNASYATAHNAAAGTVRDTTSVIQVVNQLYSGIYYVARGFLCFDTSSLGAGATISGAAVSLYGQAGSEVNASQSDFAVFEGVQADPVEADDFGDHLSKTTPGQNAYYDYSADFTTGGYNDITLNATGIGWINKTGTTKFCIRNRGDVNGSTPTGLNYIGVWTNEKGSGYQPKLVITYEDGGGTEKESSDSGAGADARDSFPGAVLGGGEAGSGAEAAAVNAGLASGDTGTGADNSLSSSEEELSGGDSGGGSDGLKAVIAKAGSGSDMRLPGSRGQVQVPSRRVNL